MTEIEFQTYGEKVKGTQDYAEAILAYLQQKNPANEFDLKYGCPLFDEFPVPPQGWANISLVTRGKFNLFRRIFPNKKEIAKVYRVHYNQDRFKDGVTYKKEVTITSFDESLLPLSKIEEIVNQIENDQLIKR